MTVLSSAQMEDFWVGLSSVCLLSRNRTATAPQALKLFRDPQDCAASVFSFYDQPFCRKLPPTQRVAAVLLDGSCSGFRERTDWFQKMTRPDRLGSTEKPFRTEPQSQIPGQEKATWLFLLLSFPFKKPSHSCQLKSSMHHHESSTED